MLAKRINHASIPLTSPTREPRSYSSKNTTMTSTSSSYTGTRGNAFNSYMDIDRSVRSGSKYANMYENKYSRGLAYDLGISYSNGTYYRGRYY